MGRPFPGSATAGIDSGRDSDGPTGTRPLPIRRPAARHDTSAAGLSDAVEAWPAATYPGFGFERYDDMQALLVIDPVHEVGDFGWPSRSADDSEKA